MGFFSFLKKVFAGEGEDDAELNAARARHGIQLSEKDKLEADETTTEEERFRDNYDVWEDLKHYRSNFFFGGWINSRLQKFRPVGEEKVKQQLEELEKKREEERIRREEKAKKEPWDKWEHEKDKR